MLKISVALLLACAFSTTSAIAGQVVNTKTINPSLQQVKFTVPKSNSSQIDGTGYTHDTPLNTSLQDKQIIQNSGSEPTPTTAQIGLLATALLCFVVRSSRRKV
jgi:hypothetical protein